MKSPQCFFENLSFCNMMKGVNKLLWLDEFTEVQTQFHDFAN